MTVLGASVVASAIAAASAPGSALATPAPSGVSAARVSTDAHKIAVSWKAVDSADHYEVSVFDGLNTEIRAVSGNVTSVVLEAPDNCATYKIKIGARDSANRGGTTGYYIVRSLAPAAVQKPIATRGAADRSRGTVSWTAPAWAGNSPVTGYQTRLVNLSTGEVVADATTTDLSVDYPSLDRLDSFVVSITPQNSYGGCSVAQAAFLSDRPGAPGTLTATRKSGAPATVTATWQKPTYGQPVEYYLVGSGVGRFTSWERVEASVTSKTLNLDPAQPWVVQIQAYNAVGPATVRSNVVSVPAVGGAAAGSPTTGSPTPKPSTPAKTDKVPPTITATMTRPLNENGWYDGPVEVKFTCADNASGITSCSGPVTVTDEAASQIITAQATDGAGNVGTMNVSLNIDHTAPKIVAQKSVSGWANGPVTVTFACTDHVSDVAACTSPTTLSEEGAGQQVAGTVTDRAGNTASTSVTVDIDRTAPTINAHVSAQGWQHGPVKVTFDCADALSGIASCPAPVTVDAEGAGQVISGTTVDKAGNKATASVTVDLDRTAPSILAVTPEPNRVGWFGGPVTVGFNCTDALSDVSSCTDPVTLTKDGVGQVVTGSTTDRAGNTATTSTTINIDTTAPTVTASVVGTANASGWYSGPVTVRFTCSDALSGVAFCPADIKVTGTGSQTITGTATDLAGNLTTVSAIVNIDTGKPTITAARSAGANGNGWNNGSVTIIFTCADPTSTVVSCTAPVTLTADGKNQSASGTATDRAGNTATASINGINIDRTPPTISATVTAGTKNGNGWYKGAVTVHFSCSDALSGLAFCPADLVIDRTGGSQLITGTATDVAGNAATATLTVNIDKVVPVITGTVVGTKSSSGWYKTAVTVHFNCSDAASGVSSCPADVKVDKNAANQSVKGSVTDLAGNSADVTVNGINIDTGAPTVTVVGVNSGGTYQLDRLPSVGCTTVDQLSGISVQAAVSLTRGNDGAYTATCTGGTDGAGNLAAAKSVKYTVVPTLPALTALVTQYVFNSGVPNAAGTVNEILDKFAHGQLCEYLGAPAKQPVLTAPQISELVYWFKALDPRC